MSINMNRNNTIALSNAFGEYLSEWEGDIVEIYSKWTENPDTSYKELGVEVCDSFIYTPPEMLIELIESSFYANVRMIFEAKKDLLHALEAARRAMTADSALEKTFEAELKLITQLLEDEQCNS